MTKTLFIVNKLNFIRKFCAKVRRLGKNADFFCYKRSVTFESFVIVILYFSFSRALSGKKRFSDKLKGTLYYEMSSYGHPVCKLINIYRGENSTQEAIEELILIV